MTGRRLPRYGVALAATAWFVATRSRTAVAHAGEHDDGGLSTTAATSLFVAGTVVLAVAVALDHAGEIDRRLADVGVVLGAVAALAGIMGAAL